MPRTARRLVGGLCYHVINRGNGRATLFHGPADYAAFMALIDRCQERLHLPLIGYCLMPNHIHLVAWPRQGSDLGRWMQWLLTTHVRRHHRRHGTDGHLWQGRYKAFAIEADGHLLSVLRYVEANPARAGLVGRASDWRWSSLAERATAPVVRRLDASPVPLPADWLAEVERPLEEPTLAGLRRSVNRGTPFGNASFPEPTAEP